MPMFRHRHFTLLIMMSTRKFLFLQKKLYFSNINSAYKVINIFPMNRYLTLDFFRGVLLIIMTFDHITDRLITWGFGYFSAAEGFVFLSGIVAGIVFSNKQVTLGNKAVRRYLFRRAFKIYQFHLLCLLILFILVQINFSNYNAFWEITDFQLVDKPFLIFLLSIPFLYLPFQIDILPMYCVFILVSAVFFNLDSMRKRTIFLILSFVLWLINSFGLSKEIANYLLIYIPVALGKFEMCAWQFLFFLGVFIGHLQSRDKLSSINKLPVFILALFVAASALIMKRITLDEIYLGSINLTGIHALGVIRLMNFLSIVYIIYYLSANYYKGLQQRLINILGQNSLHVFVYQTIMIIILIPYSYKYFEEPIIDINNMKHTVIRLIFIIFSCTTIFIPAIINTRKKRANKAKSLMTK